MTRQRYIVFAVLGSVALLLGAFGFQHLGGLAPCKLCIWQRWPHAIAIVAGVAAMGLGQRLWIAIGALAAATTSAFGIYHTGVERGWWEGPTTCTGGGGLSGLSGTDLLSTESVAMPIMCDEVAWEFMTLSMASWNSLLAFGLLILWLKALRA